MPDAVPYERSHTRGSRQSQYYAMRHASTHLGHVDNPRHLGESSHLYCKTFEDPRELDALSLPFCVQREAPARNAERCMEVTVGEGTERRTRALCPTRGQLRTVHLRAMHAELNELRDCRACHQRLPVRS